MTADVPPVLPCVMDTLEGDAASVNVGVAAAITVRLTVAVCVKLPDAPVIVTVDVPVAAVLLAVRVKVLVVVAVAGLKEAVTPLGSPEADSATLLLNPF